MRVTIKPGRAIGAVVAPPSKSVAHRCLICAAMADGVSRISPIECSEDILATVECLRRLGAKIDLNNGVAEVVGTCGKIANSVELFCRESGSTLRFILPLALLNGGDYRFTGAGRLMERPQDIYRDICESQGILFKQDNNSIHVSGKLKSGRFEIPGHISSQFFSGLLFALSQIPGKSEIIFTSPLESRPYLDLTVSAMRRFGVDGIEITNKGITIPGGAAFHARNDKVEGDCSNAAFFEALNLAGSNVKVAGISPDTLQGDRIAPILLKEIADGSPIISLADCPDLGPVLMAAAALQNGAKFINAGRLKIKESDRGEAMKEELSKFSVPMQIDGDTITVAGGLLKAPNSTLCSHGDHRIAMALSVLCCAVGGTIEGAQAVAKSMPDFFLKLESLGMEIEYDENE